MIEILEPGPFASVQDDGRRGYARLGVARSGAFDRAALALANRLVGNPDAAAGVEITLGGLTVRFVHAATVALTGAPCAGLGWGVATSLPSGSVIRLGTPASGARSYLAVRGGLDVATELGSRSTDTLGGLGPAPLQAGDRLAVGRPPATQVSGASAVLRPFPPVLRVYPGPRCDWFADPISSLVSTRWTVHAHADRVGIRLDGPQLLRTRHGELASEATLPGAVQVPPGGRPVLLGPDAPVTGGYPVVAVVADADLDRAAQLKPGDQVQFVPPH